MLVARKKTAPVSNTAYWTEKSGPYLSHLSKPRTLSELVDLCRRRNELELFYDVLAYLSFTGKAVAVRVKDGRRFVTQWMVTPEEDLTTNAELEELEDEDAYEEPRDRLAAGAPGDIMADLKEWVAYGATGDLCAAGPDEEEAGGEARDDDPGEPDAGPPLEADRPCGGSGGDCPCAPGESC